MDNKVEQQKLILNIIRDSGIFDSSILTNKNTLLNNLLHKKRRKVRLQKVIGSMFNKKKNHRKLGTEKKIEPENNKKFLSLIEQFSENDFKKNFIMKRSTLMELVVNLECYWKAKTGRPSISLKTALYITMWKLTRNYTFREISELFNISKGGTFTCFIKVVHLLYTHRKEFIKWPNDIVSKLQIMEKFQNLIKNSVPFTIGCVDATHISIIGPKQEKDSYLNKLGEYSIILQGICDSEQKFIDVYFEEPGSYSKASVWNNSPINETLSKMLETREEYILGDSEYPLKTYLIVPYVGILTSKQKLFNYQHSSTRFCVEQAFKTLKLNFPILSNMGIKNLDYIKYIVIACVVLHNIIIENESINDPHCKIDEESICSNGNDYDLNDRNELNKAKFIRDKLAMRSESL